MATITGIYRITNTLNGKCYIGQSADVHRRWKQHLRNARIGSTKCSALYEAIKKYGADKFVLDTVIICDRKLLDWHERLAISGANSLSPNGYNLTFGGNENTIVSEATKVKIGNASRGRIKSSEEIKKIKDGLKKAKDNGHVPWNKGKKLEGTLLDIVLARNKSRIGIPAWNKGVACTEETKRKLSEAKKGTSLSDDTKQKLSEAMLGREITWGDKISKTLKGHTVSNETKLKLSLVALKGKVIACSNGKTYTSVSSAEEDTGALHSNIIAVCKGRRKSAVGLNFWYEEVA